MLRRIRVGEWRKRKNLSKELYENSIYLLLNRERKEIYFGETEKSLSTRYPIKQAHHSFEEWDEYCIIELPSETTKHTRVLIERVLIAVGSKLFPNIFREDYILNEHEGLILRNKKK